MGRGQSRSESSFKSCLREKKELYSKCFLISEFIFRYKIQVGFRRIICDVYCDRHWRERFQSWFNYTCRSLFFQLGFTCVLFVFRLCFLVFHLCLLVFHLFFTWVSIVFSWVSIVFSWVFHLCFTCVSLLFHLCFLVFHLCHICVSLVFRLCITSVSLILAVTLISALFGVTLCCVQKCLFQMLSTMHLSVRYDYITGTCMYVYNRTHVLRFVHVLYYMYLYGKLDGKEKTKIYHGILIVYRYFQYNNINIILYLCIILYRYRLNVAIWTTCLHSLK